MLEELQAKNGDKQYELCEQQDSAKEKGVTLHPKENQMKKFHQLKERVNHLKNHCTSLEGLYKNKGDTIIHDNDQIKISVRNLESQLKNMHHSLEHDQEESIKVIKRAKENPKLQAQNG